VKPRFAPTVDEASHLGQEAAIQLLSRRPPNSHERRASRPRVYHSGALVSSTWALLLLRENVTVNCSGKMSLRTVAVDCGTTDMCRRVNCSGKMSLRTVNRRGWSASISAPRWSGWRRRFPRAARPRGSWTR